MSVLIYLETAVSFYLYVILTIHSYHWHLAQHIQHVKSFRLLVGLHVIAYAVYILLYELLLDFDNYAVEFLVPGDGIIVYCCGILLCQA